MLRLLLQSYFISLKASRKLGKATREIGKGNREDAYDLAMEGLLIMTNPKVNRGNPSEQSTILHLTYLADNLAQKLDRAVPSEQDYVDSYRFIQELAGKPVYERYEKWLGSIEDRLGFVPEPLQKSEDE